MKNRPKKHALLRVTLSFILASSLLLSGVMTAHMAFADTPAPGTPTAVNGRILTPRYSGDSVNWVEIAQCGDYSLIVRSTFINWYGQESRYGDPNFQYTPFAVEGWSTNYSTSRPRTIANNWFNGVGYDSADRLPANARLREFTMTNNALSTLGTASVNAGITNGISHPNTTYASSGNDVAFILSFSEAYNFISYTNFIRERGNVQDSNPIARANYGKIVMPTAYGYAMFFRSPGDTSNTIGSLLNLGYAFQITTDPNSVAGRGMTYPALWVDSRIFDPDYAYVTVEYKDAATGEVLAAADNYKINLFEGNSYGPYYAKEIRFFENGVLAPYSDPISGTAVKNQEVKITYLYTRGEATVTVVCWDFYRNVEISSTTETVPAGSYGPYEPPEILYFDFIGVSSLSDPAAGEIDLGGSVTIIFNYNRKIA